MKYRSVFISVITLAAFSLVASATESKENISVKTRLNHLKGTPLVLIISQIPDEITSITCQDWVMMGSGSWKGHNEFTIPAAGKPTGISIGVLDASKFDGYCKGPNDVIGHTDSGDHVGHLDGGPGNWSGSTKLTFDAKSND